MSAAELRRRQRARAAELCPTTARGTAPSVASLKDDVERYLITIPPGYALRSVVAGTYQRATWPYAYPTPACRGPLVDISRCPACAMPARRWRLGWACDACDYGWPDFYEAWALFLPREGLDAWLALLPPRPTGEPLTPGVRALATVRRPELVAVLVADAFARGLRA